ncbi:MAG: transketolase C-terminal domain-containing protein [Oscillospiraceae bacterium]
MHEDAGISAVRYPRGKDESGASTPEVFAPFVHLDTGADTLLVTYGRLAAQTAAARELLKADGITADTLRLVKAFPIETDIARILGRYRHVFFFEEGMREGGIGQKLAALFPGLHLTAADGFVKPACVARQLELSGLNAAKMAETVCAVIAP